MNIYIYQHLGLGDLISNNGLIRHLIEVNTRTKNFFIFCKKMHIKSVKFMYRDLKKIKLIPITNNPKKEKKEVDNYLNKIKEKYEIIKIGHEFYHLTGKLNPNLKTNPWHCTVNFYKQFGLPFEYRFKKTFWKRDYQKEKRLFKKLVGKNKNYVFVHDDKSRNLEINTSKLKKKFHIIRNNEKNFIFDYGLIVENAKEIHLIESSFRQLCETLKIKSKKLFLYKDNRDDYSMSLYNDNIREFTSTFKKWKEIKISKNEKSKNFLKFL